MPARPRRFALAVSIGTCLYVTTGCLPASSPPDGATKRLERTLEEARVHIAAGAAPAPSADGELGIIRSARVSPSGRAVAVVDDVAPSVKVFGDSGLLTAVLHAPGDTAADYALPVIALADHHLLLLSPDSGQGAVFDLQGHLTLALKSLDFMPLSATALSDSTWLVYGPSNPTSVGLSTWIHCLYLTHGSNIRWQSTLRDSVPTPLDSLDAPLLTVSNGVVYVDHRSTRGSAAIAAGCGDGGPTSTATAARLDALSHSGRSGSSPTLTRGEALLDLGTLKAVVGRERPKPTVLRWVYGGRRGGEWLRPFDQTSEGVNMPRSYTIMDSRLGTGVLVATARPIPQLFVVPERRLAQAFMEGR